MHQYSSLPDCETGDDIRALPSAGEVRSFGGSAEAFFHADHPDCRPPDMVASGVRAGLRDEMETMKASGPDSIDAFTEDPEHRGFAELAARVQRGMLSTNPIFPLLLLGLAVGGHLALAPERARWVPFAGAALGILAYGTAVLLLAPGWIARGFAGVGAIGEASEVWAMLGSDTIRRIARFSGVGALLVGTTVFFVSTAFLLRRTSGPVRPAPD